MVQEDKELLLRYLCMALPYGVKFECLDIKGIWTLNSITSFIDGGKVYCCNIIHRLDGVKPYLRPMSSMTEEEDKQRIQLGIWRNSQINGYSEVTQITPDISENYNSQEFQKAFVFLLKNHFDIFGLIPKDLAIAVTEENNPYIQWRNNYGR